MRNHYDCTCFKVKSGFSENVGEAVKPFKASRISNMNSHNEVVRFDVFLSFFFCFLDVPLLSCEWQHDLRRFRLLRR
jgi:hypothetical protein